MNALENLKPSESELQREMSYGKKGFALTSNLFKSYQL